MLLRLSHVQRDSITQAAADTEVLLPLAASSDQASTAAPADDDQSLFRHEGALRLDEEITDFPWFNTVTWDSIKGPRAQQLAPGTSRCQCFGEQLRAPPESQT